ncbi:YbaK/EbsC family protein [Streptomyces sp. LHD-70]|uniref:YbaK/EbsC family protein n=1 Tax=Streptomyces sp. LHD-70 TaxID=3072140 RepID=UPI00280D837B|nr:YbaK/EbsC family protein [Streptomyces sp. LHD-70]MDQ8706750.1 YbaK/EbsC family protein [Streptomyces sp. LHD-70]
MTSSPHTDAHPRFAEALRELGLESVLSGVRSFPDATRTAAQAAEAVGCALGEIVKSLIFAAWGSPLLERSRELGGGVPVLVLMDGASRVDMELVRRELGAEKVTRANADVVRETTGYAIGGVPPFGHRTRTRVLADRGLLDHALVWAAAGTPHTVFPMDPKDLVAHAGGTLVDVREAGEIREARESGR